MAKIVLGQRPEKFSRKVRFPMLDGTEGVILCDFKFRTKSEYAKLVDDLNASIDVEPAAEGAKLPGFEEITRMAIAKNAGYMMDILVGWDVAGELNAENLQELADTYPAAAIAIMDAYRIGSIEGKLGN